MRTEKRTPDGREIIAREPALTPHPHPRQGGRLVPTAGISRLLLEDDGELFECDRCGKLFATALSVRGHMSTHGDPPGPVYPEKTLKTLIREVTIAQRDGHRAFHAVAARRLNELGVPTIGGQPWTASSVSSLFNRWKDEVRVRVPGGREARPASSPPVPSGTPVNGVNADIAGQIARIKLALDQACGQLGDLGEAIARVGQAIAALPAVDAQATEDARRFRELQKLMGGSS